MTDAPERIWADSDALYPEQNGGFWWGEECRGVEYLRADLIPEMLTEQQAKVLEAEGYRRGLKAALAAVKTVNGWTGQPHQSNLEHGPTTAAKCAAVIAALIGGKG